mmetsp:Transcript_36404/g.53202  ORF Transcript_36404/g.53202 Transcript_36404/m.53202 type:complete len:217 (+) Transcript_36404:327-977(+)
MRWVSLVFVAASTAEMLISGLELILSTVAARLIRKRLVSKMRWMGVVVVALGLVLVRIADSSGGDADASGDDNMDASMSGNGMNNYSITTTNDEGGLSDNNTATTTNSANYNRLIGDVLIIGQCIMSIIQDMAEEIFIQESDFPPTLLLETEGCFGLLFGLPFYFTFASHFGESPQETWVQITSSTFNICYMISLTCLFHRYIQHCSYQRDIFHDT